MTPAGTSRWADSIVVVLAVGWALLRLLWLETSPPGFFVDELGGALNSICLWQTGSTFYGEPWAVFPIGAGGGVQSAPFIYLGALFSGLLGNSIFTFRLLTALFSVGTLAGLFFLARLLVGRDAAWFVALAGALSPWSFQYARISWDAAIFPFFVVWGLYFLFRSPRPAFAAVAGVLFSIAAYCYSAGKLQVVLILALVLCLWPLHRRVPLKSWLLAMLVCGIVSIPLIRFGMTPQGLERAGQVGIVTPAFLAAQADGSYLTLGGIFLDNFRRHFTPDFLFVHGDRNGRHSTAHAGHLSWLDGLAIAFAGVGVFRVRRWDRRRMFFVLLCAGGIAAGVVPAALTWEGVPHSLRASGAWPFFALFSGWMLWRGCREFPRLQWLVVAIALSFSEIVVCDDGSADRGATERVAKQFGCRYVALSRNMGKAAAVRAGMLVAHGRVRVFTDADLPFEVEAFDRFYDHLTAKDCHVVVGDRTLPASSYFTEVPLIRRIGSAAYARVVGTFIGGGWRDTQCGLKGFQAQVAEDLFSVSRINRFGFDVELLHIALTRQYTIKRLPVRLRNQGPSSVRLVRDGVRMFWDLALLWHHQRRGHYRR